MVMITSTPDRDLGRRTVGGAVSFDDIALADEMEAHASSGTARRSGVAADKWAGAAGSFGDSFGGAPHASVYAAATTSPPAATPAATPSRSELIAIYWQAHRGTPSTIIQGMRDFGVSVAEFAAATGQSADALGRYLQAGGAEDGFGGWFAPVAAAAAASVASTTVAVAATPSRSAIIAEYWQAYRGTPSTIVQGMRNYGVSVAEFAAATGQNADALGRYLQAGGAEDGFGGWFAPVVTAAAATTAPVTSTRSTEHNALIRVFWEANQGSVKTISDAMSEFKVSVAELAYATGQSVEQVERYLMRGAVAAATTTTTGASTTEQGSSAKATDLSSGSDSIGDVTAHAQGSTTSTGTVALTNTAKTEAAKADATQAPTSQLTPDQLTRVANYWTEHQADPYRIMQSMVENQVNAIDLAVATGQSVQDVADYLSRNGAPAGFADSGCVDRDQVDAAFLRALNAAAMATPQDGRGVTPVLGTGWSKVWHGGHNGDAGGYGYVFNTSVFIAWYASQATAGAKAFVQLHGVNFSESGAKVQAGHWQTGERSNHWVGARVVWGETQLQAGERIHAYLGYAQADAEERAMVDLSLGSDTGKELLANFGGTASLPETEQGERMRSRFGTERATELYRYGLACQALRERFVDDLNHSTLGVDIPAFVQWYTDQDTPTGRLFGQLYGAQVITEEKSSTQTGDAGGQTTTWTERFIANGQFQLTGGHYQSIDDAGQPQGWVALGLIDGSSGLVQVNLADPPELYEPSLVRFDPTLGFVTPFENVVVEADVMDSLGPILMGIALGLIAGPGIATALDAAGNVIVIAGAGAVVSSSFTSLMLTGKIDLEDVLSSTFTAILTAGVSQTLGLDKIGMGVDAAGKAVITDYAAKAMAIGAKAAFAGMLAELTHGNVKASVLQVLVGALADTVVSAINTQIDGSTTLSPMERSNLRLLASAAGSAIKIMGAEGDPRLALATEFMNDLLSNIDTKGTQGTGPWSDKDYENGLDLEGDKPLTVVTVPADPFVVASDGYNDGAKTYSEALTEYLGLLDGDIVDAGWTDYLPDARSLELLKGFVQGSGFSLLNMGEAVVEIAKHPVQFIDGIKALINSPEARAQLGEAIVTQVKVDLQILEDAYNSGDWLGTGQQLGKLTTDLAQAAGGVEAIAKLGVTTAKAGGRLLLNAAEDLALTRRLYQMGGMLDSDGKALMDFSKLTSQQKQVIGELMGPDVVKGIVPDAERLGRIQSAGTNGIDDLYKVTRPDVDYLIVEYKFGQSTLGTSADGLQMSDGWVLGSERILKSVGDPAEALKIKDAVALGRVEKWIVHTDPAGGTSVWIVDAAGKIIKADSTLTSKILGGTK